ncbi:hypothetical protein E2P81_ATG02769 [Venturia nashicola]|uniref:Uncharacterized protein n=1 Tax=Venturia nashicola TaxID=86259 RepID=A0A4Z1P686_9PEZI|nr:hypothetical protein E6O75_ATG02828 [Venturia nashicola]TLD36987.1 hypothetical protein E2P81_ATG02769 [Venturia nashicola]
MATYSVLRPEASKSFNLLPWKLRCRLSPVVNVAPQALFFSWTSDAEDPRVTSPLGIDDILLSRTSIVQSRVIVDTRNQSSEKR